MNQWLAWSRSVRGTVWFQHSVKLSGMWFRWHGQNRPSVVYFRLFIQSANVLLVPPNRNESLDVPGKAWQTPPSPLLIPHGVITHGNSSLYALQHLTNEPQVTLHPRPHRRVSGFDCGRGQKHDTSSSLITQYLKFSVSTSVSSLTWRDIQHLSEIHNSGSKALAKLNIQTKIKY